MLAGELCKMRGEGYETVWWKSVEVLLFHSRSKAAIRRALASPVSLTEFTPELPITYSGEDKHDILPILHIFPLTKHVGVKFSSGFNCE